MLNLLHLRVFGLKRNNADDAGIVQNAIRNVPISLAVLSKVKTSVTTSARRATHSTRATIRAYVRRSFLFFN